MAHMLIDPPNPHLHDELVTLRPWTMDDVAGVTSACQDPEIARWTTIPWPYSEDDARTYLAEAIRTDVEDRLTLAMASSADRELVGSIAFWMVKPGVGEFGYWAAHHARGRGYTTHALRLLTGWVFRELRLPRVQLGTFPGNRSSERVAEKAGFTSEGVLRSYMDQRGERRDIRMWSLLPWELRRT